jgi:ABC-type multidrug transport system fused ATPase/permease subunit
MGPPRKLDAWRWLAGLARPFAGRLALAAGALVVSAGVSLTLPAVAGRVVDAALVEKSLVHLRAVIAGLLGLFVVNGVVTFAEVYVLRSTAALLLTGLRERLHGHLMTLTPAFFESQRTGDLLSRLSADVEQIGTALTQDLVNGLNQALVLVGALAILLSVHRGLTLVMVLAVPPVVIAAVIAGVRLERLSKERQEAAAEASVVAEESLAGVRTVQAFAREGFERGRYADRLARFTALAHRTARAWGIFSGVVSALAFSALALVLAYGGALVIRGELTAGALTSFLLYTLSLAGAVGSLTALYGGLKTAAGATERVRQILDTRPEVLDPEEPLVLSRARGRVELRGVRFAYPSGEGRSALAGVSLDVREGEVVAIVGPSGAGKSTIISLILRFYDPAEGRVLLDGEDVRRYRLADLRGAIGLVPQDIFLFGGTIAENIRYGALAAKDEDIRRAAEAAQAHGFIAALPKGYDALIGERGTKLSTGERQRIAIARVFLKDPPIVVLDEATSALDSESEHLVQAALERLMAGRTTIVIAHRLATVRRAHRVVLVEKGAIADEGTHQDLFARNPLYRRICELQMLDQVEPPAAAPAAPPPAIPAAEPEAGMDAGGRRW